MTSLNGLTREQLAAMLHTRDEEIASLRAINKQSAARLADLDRSLSAMAERFKAMEQVDAECRAAKVTLTRQQNDVTSRVALIAEEKEQLLKQIDSLGQLLEREVVDRRGSLLSLGLKLVTGQDGAVVVAETRSPAREAGVETGDILTGVRLASNYAIHSLTDYSMVVADLTPDANAELSLARRGRQVSVLVRPSVVVS